MPLQVWDKAAFDNNYRIPTSYSRAVNIDPDTFKVLKWASINAHYSRQAMMPISKNHSDMLVEGLGLTPADRIVFLGSGFGWMAEAMSVDHGITQTLSLDTSAYIQSDKDTSERADLEAILIGHGIDIVTGILLKHPLIDGQFSLVSAPDTITDWLDGDVRTVRTIIAEDLLSGASQARVRIAAGGGKVDWAISETVLETLDDAECLDLSSGMHGIANNVCHLVVPFRPRRVDINEVNPWNWKWPQNTSDLTSPHLDVLPWYTNVSWKNLLPDDLIVPVTGAGVY